MSNGKDVAKCVKILRKVVCKSGSKKCVSEMSAICQSHLEYKKHGVNLLDFPKMQADLNTKLAVYVPDTKGISQRISKEDHRKRAAEVEKRLRDLFGGTTTIRGVGTWASVSCPKGTCRDNILLVETYMPEKVWKEKHEEMKRYLNSKKKEWGQHSLTIEFEIKGKNSLQEGMHFI